LCKNGNGTSHFHLLQRDSFSSKGKEVLKPSREKGREEEPKDGFSFSYFYHGIAEEDGKRESGRIPFTSPFCFSTHFSPVHQVIEFCTEREIQKMERYFLGCVALNELLGI